MIPRAGLLTREQFREQVFRRDENACVVPGCQELAADAHHLIERRLWTAPGEQEGYFIDNGASLCEYHHRFGAETCVLQPQVLRMWAGIINVVLPCGWDPSKSYDKWGTVLDPPTRTRIKYPSTPYLPMSPGFEENDINLPDLKPFLNVPLFMTIKLDGSNVQCTREHVAARNGNVADHPSFDMLKAEHARFRWSIPEGVQVFGEWLYAKHSIHYTGPLALQNRFQVFGVYYQDRRMFGSWQDVEEMAKTLGYPTTPVILRGTWSEEWELRQALEAAAVQVIAQGHEGLVVRVAHPFPYANFEGYETTNGKTTWRVSAIGKYVRADHVQTDAHWSRSLIIKNEIS